MHSEKNFVAKVWRSLKNKIDEVSSANHGWNEYGMTFSGLTEHWAFPHDISGVFFDNLYDDEQFDFGGDNEESEDENGD